MKKQKLKKKKYIPQKLSIDTEQDIFRRLDVDIDKVNNLLFELVQIW